MSSKLRRNKTVKSSSDGNFTGSGRVRMSEAQRKKNRRLMILSILAIIAGFIISVSQSVSNQYTAVLAYQDTARTEAAALKTAADDLAASKKAEKIADSEEMKSLKEAAERISDSAGMPELHSAVEDINQAVSLLAGKAEKEGADLTAEIKTISDAAEKTEKALVVANAGAVGFNEMRGKLINKIFADTMGVPEIATF